MGLLILVFLILGVGGGGRFPDAFRGARADSVVTAGGHATSATDYRRIFDQQKQRFEQETKQAVTAEYLVRNGFDEQLLSQIALDDAQAEMLARAGVEPDASLIDAQIRQIPVAFDRVTGKFSEKQFTEFLASQGLTPRQVQVDLTDELAERHFGYALAAGFKAPRAYAALTAIVGLQYRDVSYFTLDAKAVVQPPAPTDAQLAVFEKAHASQLTRPEMRVITLTKFSAAALAPSVSISDADVEKEFSVRKDSLSTPETRSIVQIPVKTAAEGADAAKRLSKGENPTSIARSFGGEPVIYDNRPLTAIADGKLATAAFALKEGQVSGPVQGELGLAAIKVVRITPGITASLETAKPKIVSDLRAKAAQNRAYELSQKFDDARQAGAGIAAAALKAGVPTTSVGPFTADGLDAQGKPIPQINDKIAKAASAMRANEDSDIQDAGPGEYYAMKIDQVLAPALPTLDDIRAPLTQAYLREQLISALKARANTLMAELRQGKPMEQAAAEVGGLVARQQDLQVMKAQQYQALGREFLTQIFNQKQGAVFAAGAPNGIFIARLDAIRPGDVAATARFLETIRQRASQDYLRDIVANTKEAAEKAIKVSINLKLARQAVGVDPASVAKTGAGGGGAAK